MKNKHIETAIIDLGKIVGSVKRKIYEYEGKAVFKHNGSWHYCKNENGSWVRYYIHVSATRISVPNPTI